MKKVLERVGLTCLVLIAALFLGCCGAKKVWATASTLELTISDSTVNVNIGTLSSAGTFKKSAVTTVGAKTSNATGYTLSIAARNDDTDPEALKNTEDNTVTLDSIDANVDENDFSAITAVEGTTNRWGYYFIRHGSVASNAPNTFSPAPTTSGTEIEKTNVANPTTANEYDLAIGARIDSTVRIGSYSNTYIVQLVSNAIPYTMVFTDTLTNNMPVDVSSTSMNTNVSVPNNTPKKPGYTFIGWCNTAPTANALTDTCSGTTYQPGSNYVIDQTGNDNNLHLYTMWKRNTMQNVSEWKDTLNIGDETTAIDTRDGKTYNVAKYCVNYSGDTCTATQIWMTQNLDLILGIYGVRTLTSDNSDINQDLGSTMGYSTTSGVITWTPNSTLNTPAYITNFASGNPASSLSGWTNSNEIPYQAEGSDYYVFTSGNNNADTIYSSLAACIAGGHTAELCSHYHVGNYYNWSAAVAGNDTSGYTTDLTVMPNSICPKGWRLPNGLTGTTGNETISEFNQLALANGITGGTTTAHSGDSDRWINTGWLTNGFNNFRSVFTNSHGDSAPMYFVRSGYLNGSVLYGYSTGGYLWSSTVRSASWGYYLDFDSGGFRPARQSERFYGFPVRCLVR